MSTNYPTTLDDDDSMYNVTDNIDDVLAVHHNALKEAIIAIETALGITGAFNFTTDAEFSAHTTSNPNAHHTPTIASDLNHNDLNNINAGDAYEHITQTQKDALHAIVTTLTHTALTGKNDEANIKHLTDAQQTALHAIYALTNDLAAGEITQLQAIGDVTISYAQWGYVGELTASIKTHMDAANPHSGSASSTDLSNHASATSTHGKTTIAGMEDLHAQSHDNTYHSTNYEVYNANIQSHVASPPADSHHAKYALLDDLIANEITVIKAIDDASINNTKWDYIAALSESPQTHMSASNPHSGSAGSGDLHAETHALATSGPHTGTLPLADLAVGSAGSVIIRGASDWEELIKADDSDVLTLVSGLPAWVAQGAPGIHDIITGHNDTGLTIGNVITATGATTFAWQAPVDYEAELLIGSANAAIVACTLDIAGYYDETNYGGDQTRGQIYFRGVFDNWVHYTIPLPCNRGGKSLRIKNIYVGVSFAGGSDYVSRITVYELSGTSGTSKYSDDTNRTAIGLYTYTPGTPLDMDGGYKASVNMLTFNTGDGGLAVNIVSVNVYYE